MTSTTNFGAERDFYTLKGDTAVDELITEYEGEIQEFVERLSEGDGAALSDRNTIAALISHLETRSSFLRSQLLTLADVMQDFFANTLGDHKKVVQFLKLFFKKNPEVLRKGIVENLGEEAPLEAIEQFVAPQIGRLIEEQASELALVMADGLIQMRSAVSSAVKPSHLKALLSHPNDLGRAKFYSELNYSVRKAPTGSFILPDTMIAFCTKNKVRNI